MTTKEFDKELEWLDAHGWHRYTDPIDREVVNEVGCEHCGNGPEALSYAVGVAKGVKGTDDYRYRVFCVCPNCDTVTEF